MRTAPFARCGQRLAADNVTTMSESMPKRHWPAMSIAQAHALLTQPGSPLEMGNADIRGIMTRVWKNAPPTLRELLTVARAAYASRELLVYENDRITYE